MKRLILLLLVGTLLFTANQSEDIPIYDDSNITWVDQLEVPQEAELFNIELQSNQIEQASVIDFGTVMWTIDVLFSSSEWGDGGLCCYTTSNGQIQCYDCGDDEDEDEG